MQSLQVYLGQILMLDCSCVQAYTKILESSQVLLRVVKSRSQSIDQELGGSPKPKPGLPAQSLPPSRHQ